MDTKLIKAAALSVLLTSFVSSTALAQSTAPESRAEKKGVSLEQKSQEMETKAQTQESEGHPLRAGRDAKVAARKGARAERKFKKAGITPGQPGTVPAQQ
jgi:hypothetical protein